MRRQGLPALAALSLLAAILVLPAGAQQPPAIPTPEQFFGFPMGADRQLAHWDRMVEYFNLIGERSDRVQVRELGKSTLGHPYLLIAVSTPDTIRDLPRYQAMQRELADPRVTPPARAEEIARTGKAVVLIGANVHATEIGTNQVMNDLIHRLATERSAWVDHLLEHAVVLLIPSQNPDGQRMVVEWYRRNLDTPYEGSPLPHLYHKYAGHDNNRDSYMLTLVETRYLNQVLYQEWLPEVYLDTHQMGNRNARIFVPPFKNPPNPNVDPLIWSQVNQLGQAMASKLHEADKPGVIWGELYSGFWQGANNTNPWWHNMVGLLTEVASADLGTPVRQQRISASRRLRLPRGESLGPRRGLGLPLAPPRDIQARMNYPRPWRGGLWTPADVVDYHALAMDGLLESVANNRTTLKRNFYLMNQRAIERFAGGSPYAFVIPAGQGDPAAAARLVRLLQAEAAEVDVAEAPFVADGTVHPAGSYVVRLAQPFGRWVKDVLEPQRYPDIRWPYPSAPIDKPYDVTAWSLGMLMGVDTVQVERPFEAELRPLDGPAAIPPGQVAGSGDAFVIAHDANRSFTALNRLLAAGASVSWATEELDLGSGRRYGRGAMLVTSAERTLMEEIAADLRLQVAAADIPDELPRLPIHAPRVALYEPWGGSMDAGWTRLVLDQHEFPYVHARSADLRAGDLYDRFDVVILPEMNSVHLIQGLRAPNVRPEYRDGIGAPGIHNLLRFVEEGGTLITLGNSAAFAIEHLGAPLVNVVRGQSEEAFYCPGSILRLAIDVTHPIGYGMPREADAMFVANGGYRTARTRRNADVRVVARYPDAPLLRSGWLVGEERLRGTGAVMEVSSGKGRIILHTFRVQHRSQTEGTFRLLFNSIFYGPAVSGLDTPFSTLDAH